MGNSNSVFRKLATEDINKLTLPKLVNITAMRVGKRNAALYPRTFINRDGKIPSRPRILTFVTLTPRSRTGPLRLALLLHFICMQLANLVRQISVTIRGSNFGTGLRIFRTIRGIVTRLTKKILRHRKRNKYLIHLDV